MKRLLTHISVIIFIGFVALSGLANVIDKSVGDARFKLNKVSASGDIVLIAIDSKSLQEIKKWPWPRSLHANLIDKLQKAGAAEIAFDIDFSATTTDKEDRALQEALKRANGSIILPTFKQVQKTSQQQEVVYTLPLERFKDHAWLATVNIVPGRNGQIEKMAYGHIIQKEFVPSFAAMLTGKYQPNAQDFFIDFSINANSIPVFSFIDVLNDRIKTELLTGKKIVIGATATELGDYVFVPSQGLIAGPVLQILAAETILQNRQLHTTKPTITLIGLLVIAFLVISFTKKVKFAERPYIFLLMAIAIEVFAAICQIHNNLIVNTALWHLTLLAYFTAILLHEIDFRKVIAKMMRLKLATTQHMFEQVFNDSFTGTIITNQDGIIQAASKTANYLLKIEEDTSLIGQHFKTVFPDEIVIAAQRLLSQANQPNHTNHYSSKIQIHSEKGEPITLDYIITLSSLLSDQPAQQHKKHILSFSFQDITARDKAETAQKDAIEAANQANKAKTEFLATMSHELRTPLNSIIGFSDIIQTSSPDNNNNAEFAKEIKTSGEQLLKIVNDILMLSKMESKSLTLMTAPCSPLEMIQNATETSTQAFKDKAPNFIFSHPNEVADLNVDLYLCQEILTEIFSNAIKFSPDNSDIKISMQQEPTGDFNISITDYGCGISRQEIENIFAPFYQIDSANNRQFEGTGLGLTKANAFMKLHNGKIKVDSTLGQGSTFHLNFPETCIMPQKSKVIDITDNSQTIRQSA